MPARVRRSTVPIIFFVVVSALLVQLQGVAGCGAVCGACGGAAVAGFVASECIDTTGDDTVTIGE